MSKKQVEAQMQMFRPKTWEIALACDNARVNTEADSPDSPKPSDPDSKEASHQLNGRLKEGITAPEENNLGFKEKPNAKENDAALAGSKPANAMVLVEFTVALKIMEQQQRLLQGLADGSVVGSGASWSIADMQIQIDEYKKKMGLWGGGIRKGTN